MASLTDSYRDDSASPANNHVRFVSIPLSPFLLRLRRLLRISKSDLLEVRVIAPALFEPYPSAADEWDLTTLMRADGTLQAKLEAHYDTFITEEDIAQIAGAGLNWVRVPIPFWAIRYIVRLFGWARKYGIRVNLDLHTIPGSQNGFNHSGKLGQVNFLNGIMGIANAQRALDYIRIIAEFISQPEYRDVVQMFGIMNEALMSTIGQEQLFSFYLEAYNMIRTITGLGAGNGPYIGIHDGFEGLSSWVGFLPGADRVILDTHPYFAFNNQPDSSPIATGTEPASAGGIWPKQACKTWAQSLNTSYGGGCSLWMDSSTWNATVKAGVMEFALASMDAMQDWFFWTWKIGNATDGVVRSPLWSYQLGLEGGWMPSDPRTSEGTCGALGVGGDAFDGIYSAWQTGGAGAGTIAPLCSVATLAYITPSATGNGAAVTPTVSIPNGWFDAGDTAPGVTAVAGCTYPDAWSAVSSSAPTALCTGA
ncbi:glycoside hydrolase superfamily [Mycena galericulata]|nr:glycoside hydrolase superfamily [Mycena galericulata]